MFFLLFVIWAYTFVSLLVFFSLRFLLFVLIYFGDILATGFCFLYFSSAAAEAVAALRTVHQLFDCVRILCSH